MKLRSLFAVLFALMLVVAACGSGGDSDNNSSETTATTADAGSGDDPGTTEAPGSDDGDSGATDGEPQAGGTLVIGSTQTPRHLNGTVQSGYATAVPGTQLNASPLLFDENFEPQPYLAESWEIADDGLSVTLNLVEGAVFHDGMPITSEDVAFSVITARDNHPFATMFAPVTSVDTPDPQTAVINLSQPHPAILLAMSPGLLPIIPKHIFDDGQDIKTHPRNTEDFVGSGPFKLVEYEAGSVIRMQRFDDFFIEGRPYLDEIVMEITPDPSTIVLGLENGSTHLSATLGGSANTLRLQDNPDVIVTADGHEAIGQVNWLEFNLKDPILEKLEVRQAIAYAIDREFISDVIDQGLSFPVSTGIVEASPFHNPNSEKYDLNIEKAKELLTSAGYAEGEINLTIDFLPPSGGTWNSYAEYVVQALEDIGINTELSVSPDFPTWAGRVASGDYQMTMNNVWNWGDPVIGVHRTYLTSNRQPPPGVIWSNNSWYSNDVVDEILAEAGQELDQDARIALYAQFQDIVADEVPIYFLNTPPFWQAFQPSVQNPPTGIWGHMNPMHETWLSE